MKSRLPASHLFRQFLTYSLTLLFLLTLLRAAYALWQISGVDEPVSILPLFVQGLRFDLALIGILSAVPLVFGTLLATSVQTRALARMLITGCMLAGLLLVMLTEMVTPWFLQTRGLRPDLQLLIGVEQPVQTLSHLLSEHQVPVVITLILCLLILAAFWGRLDLAVFLKRRLSVPGALLLSVVGGALCIMAIRSNTDLSATSLSPADAMISSNPTINDLTMNSAYKLLYSIVVPEPIGYDPLLTDAPDPEHSAVD